VTFRLALSRRSKVLELSSQGLSQPEIVKILQVSLLTETLVISEDRLDRTCKGISKTNFQKSIKIV
jgi:orotate phosphoribosyltransferase-like protein